MEILIGAVVLVIAIAVTAYITTSYQKKLTATTIGNAEDKAREIIDDALKAAESKKREGLLDPDFTMETAAEAIKDERYITEPTEEGITLTLGR